VANIVSEQKNMGLNEIDASLPRHLRVCSLVGLRFPFFYLPDLVSLTHSGFNEYNFVLKAGFVPLGSKAAAPNRLKKYLCIQLATTC
jgi:hypothetical protein